MVPAKDRVRSIQEMFLGTCYIHEDRINSIKDNTTEEEIPNLVYQCEITLINWEAIEILEIFPMLK